MFSKENQGLRVLVGVQVCEKLVRLIKICTILIEWAVCMTCAGHRKDGGRVEQQMQGTESCRSWRPRAARATSRAYCRALLVAPGRSTLLRLMAPPAGVTMLSRNLLMLSHGHLCSIGDSLACWSTQQDRRRALALSIKTSVTAVLTQTPLIPLLMFEVQVVMVAIGG